MKTRALVFLVLCALAPIFAHAANVSVSLTVSPSTTNASIAPTVSWTSTGAATCTASDGWSGAKAANGSETLPAVTKTTKFTLTCVSGTGPVTLGWTPPATNSDGTPITGITGYQVMMGTDPANLARGPLLPTTPTQNVVIQAPPGKQYFTLRTEQTVGTVNLESVDTATATKTVVADQAAASQTLTFAVLPNPPTGFTVQ
jgi:hypothetical protein